VDFRIADAIEATRHARAIFIDAMPTTLPDMTAPARHRRRRAFTALAPIVMTILYLLLLAWTVADLETSFGLIFERHQRLGEYNPMEPGYGTAGGRIGPSAWLKQR